MLKHSLCPLTHNIFSSITVFLDVFMSMTTFFIAYYQQWQLLKRMGWLRSALWLAIFVTVS